MEGAEPVRDVVVRQRAQHDVDRPALDPGGRVIERVHAKLDAIADSSPRELDHRR